MRAHYLQHVPFEGLGSIEDWLSAAGYEISCTRFYASDGLPRPEELDLLVIMGGPMSVNDEEAYPWLVEEKRFVSHVVQSGRPVLGICLGAQMIANALGGSVYANPVKEIGWFPVRGVSSSDDATFGFPDEVEVFHWHGETFDLPPGGIRIAESAGCRNQAFQIGRRVIGLQFHLETTEDSARSILVHCRDELVDGEYIQTEEAILSVPGERYQAINGLMGTILEYLHHEGG